MKKIRTILDHIDVSKMSPPRKEKFEKYYSYYKSVGNNNSSLIKINPIVISSDNTIIDGYCTYLIIKSSGQKTALCIKTAPGEKFQKVVHGRHIKKNQSLGKKEYCWRSNSTPIVPNEVVYLKTAKGILPIFIQRIALIPENKASLYSSFKPIHRHKTIKE